MSLRRSTILIYILLLILSVSIVVWLYRALYPDRVHLKIGVGPQGESTHLLISDIAEVVARHKPHISIEPVFTDGSSENIALIRQGDIQLGVATGDTPAVASVSLVTKLHQSYFHLITLESSGITSIQQLAGKRMTLPAAGSRELQNFWAMAGHYGLGLQSFEWQSRTQEEAIYDLVSGKSDAIFVTVPNRSKLILKLVEELGYSKGGPIKIIPVDQAPAIILRRPFLSLGSMPKGTYAGQPPQPAADIDTLIVDNYLIASGDVPDTIISDITEILFENQLDLTIRSRHLGEISHPSVNDRVIFPLHPGAQAYFTRDEPSFIQENAEPLALFVTVFTMVMTFGFGMRKRFSIDQKNRADGYNIKLLRLVEIVEQAETIEDITPVQTDMGNILREVIDDLDKDQITEDGFQSFSMTWDAVRNIIRDKNEELNRKIG